MKIFMFENIETKTRRHKNTARYSYLDIARANKPVNQVFGTGSKRFIKYWVGQPLLMTGDTDYLRYCDLENS